MHNDSYKLNINSQNMLCVTGKIYLANVKDACNKGCELIDSLGTVRVDLSGLQDADSSSLAMLIEWIRSAKKQHKDISFCNMPKFLFDLGRVCGLDAILPLAVSTKQ